MVLEAAKWSELCGAKTPMMQRKGDKSLGGIALTNTQRQQIQINLWEGYLLQIHKDNKYVNTTNMQRICHKFTNKS